MREGDRDVVFEGSSTPHFFDRPKRFVKDKIIDEHSPQAHERKILDRITRLAEGPEDAIQTKLAKKLKPTIERHSYRLGVALTVGEVTAVVAATAGAYILTERSFPKLRQRREELFHRTPRKEPEPAQQTEPDRDSDELRRNLGLMTRAELAAYNAAVEVISKGKTVEELLVLDPTKASKTYRKQRALRERMFRLMFIERANRGFRNSEAEMSQFFAVLDTVVGWAREHKDHVQAQLADISAVANPRHRANSWESLVRWIHTKAVSPNSYLTGRISDPEFFPQFLLLIEEHLGRFGDIPKRMM